MNNKQEFPHLMTKPVSNSFDYVPLSALTGFTHARLKCSMRSIGLADSHSSRALVAKVDNRYILCVTKTNDFQNTEIRHVVHECGQLYLDRSGKTQIDDFSKDVRQLTLDEVCRSCQRVEGCSAVYTPAHTDHFSEDEMWLHDRIGRLRGVVLDIGSGHLPYFRAIEANVRAGSVILHALDPDPPPIEKSRPLTMHLAAVENAQLNESGFDCCLAIRSLNHFPDIHRALENMTIWLRPGGTLILVESLPLPLLRPRKASLRSQTNATGGFQHYRNWDSYDVLRFISDRFPFRVSYHRPIGRDTTNQWILELVRM